MEKKVVWIVLLVLSLGSALAAFGAEPTSCTREEIENAIESGMTPQEITDLFGPICGTQSTMTKQNTTPTGNTYWEEIDACGYHPQRRELVCAVEVKQRFGFAGFPGVGPGSWEWVLFCVDYADGLGLVPVHVSAVHVHDEPFGVQPPWYYGVVVQDDPRLHAMLVNGQTLQARAVLSWTFVPPTGPGVPNACFAFNWRPVWGNQADFQIKLDP